MPDESTILCFRHLPEQNESAVATFSEANVVLSEKGLSMNLARLWMPPIAAPRSPRIRTRGVIPDEPDKKGNQWYFGMKTHIGVDAEGGLIYTVECMTDKVADNTLLKNCLHGNKSIIFSVTWIRYPE